tara:strand:+ start:248 stop:538 length:291 start_codon:yes stop_codon:yes gene_type:complete
MIKTNTDSPQSLALRFMREKRQLSLVAVAQRTGLKAKIIDHLENGRKIITDEDITLLLECYDYSQDVFKELMALKPLNKKTVNHYFIKNESGPQDH